MQKITASLFTLLLGIVLVGVTTVPARATVVLGFESITNTIAGDVAIGEAQLSVEISSDQFGGMDGSSDQAFFRFLNAGPAASSITQIYFDDGTLLEIAQIFDNDPGVDYVEPTNGSPNLPGANGADPDFDATAAFRAFPAPPTQPNGVNPGEEVGILFELLAGVTFADTIAALGTDLRIGIHVQGFDTGGSESFINTDIPPPPPPPPGLVIPEPSSMALFGIGLLGLGMMRRRRGDGA